LIPRYLFPYRGGWGWRGRGVLPAVNRNVAGTSATAKVAETFLAVSGLWYILAAHSGFSRGLASNGEELFYLYRFRNPAFTRWKSSSSIVPSFEDRRL